MKSKNNVLIITYYWPPSGGPGVQRWLKLANYLEEQDVEVFVLTVNEQKASYPVRDESLLSDVNEKIHVFRTDTFEVLSFYKRVNREKKIPMSGFANQHNQVSVKERLMRFIRGNFFIPDARKGWNKFAYKAASNLIDRNQIKHVITTGPPHSTHLIGLKLKTIDPALFWASDFRDPWVDVFYNKLMNRRKWAHEKDKRLQNQVLYSSDLILTVSEHLKELLNSYRASEKELPIQILPNGFDPRDFDNLKKVTSEKKQIVYLGTATGEYPLEAVLKALSESKTQTHEATFELIGSYDAHITSLINAYSSKVTVNVHPYINHKYVPQRLVNADLLVLIIPEVEDNKLIVTGKLFEYIASGNAILGIGPTDGDAAKILDETGTGKMFDSNDALGIQTFIDAALAGDFSVKRNSQQIYSRAEQAKWLKNLLFQ